MLGFRVFKSLFFIDFTVLAWVPTSGSGFSWSGMLEGSSMLLNPMAG